MITIGQLANYAGVTIKAVRHYHERGLLADGQVVSFWRPNAGVKSAIRSAGDGVKQAWSPGRARSKP